MEAFQALDPLATIPKRDPYLKRLMMTIHDTLHSYLYESQNDRQKKERFNSKFKLFV